MTRVVHVLGVFGCLGVGACIVSGLRANPPSRRAAEPTTAASASASTSSAQAAQLHIGETWNLDLATDESYVAFPDLACKGSTMYLAYRSAVNHSTGGRIRLRTSTDSGHSWSPPTTLPALAGIDARDPSLMFLPDGRAVLSRTEFSATWLGKDPIQQSRPIITVGPDPSVSPVAIYDAPFPTPEFDTTLDSGVYHHKGADLPRWTSTSDALLIGNAIALPVYGGRSEYPPQTPSRLAFAWLRTGAKGWSIEPFMKDVRPTWHLTEPSVVRLGDRRLLVAARTHKILKNPGSLGPTLFAWSSDDGATWPTVKDYEASAGKGWYGQAAALHVLRDGRVLVATRDVAWNQTWWRVALRESSDAGVTWSLPHTLSECTAADCGYASFAECTPGNVVVAYYLTNGTSIAFTRLTY